MNKTETTFTDPAVGEVKMKSEVVDGKYSNVVALVSATNNEFKCYFNGIIKFNDKNQSVSVINYKGFIMNPKAKSIFKHMIEDNGLNKYYN